MGERQPARTFQDLWVWQTTQLKAQFEEVSKMLDAYLKAILGSNT
jgi:hypothetical protein